MVQDVVQGRIGPDPLPQLLLRQQQQRAWLFRHRVDPARCVFQQRAQAHHATFSGLDVIEQEFLVLVPDENTHQTLQQQGEFLDIATLTDHFQASFDLHGATHIEYLIDQLAVERVKGPT